MPRSSTGCRSAAVAMAAHGGSSSSADRRPTRNRRARLRAAAAASGEERLDTYRSIFITGTARTPRKQVVTAADAGKPSLRSGSIDERDRVCALLERRKAVACRDRTRRCSTIADAVISRYQAEKDRRGLLDYDDLIDKTLTLLGEERAAWVHYKLDQRHRPRADRRGAGHQPEAMGDHPAADGRVFRRAWARASVRRTIFAVGDEKQSIFSFQGAAPREFDVDAQRVHYARREDRSRTAPGEVPSIRSAPARTCWTRSTRCSNGRKHCADCRPMRSSRFISRFRTPRPVSWRSGRSLRPTRSAKSRPGMRRSTRRPRGARRSGWPRRSPSTSLAGARKASGPGDVLVLVRQRGALFEAIIRALKDANIAVAGADRLVLTEHIAVMDLMVLADALLLAGRRSRAGDGAEEPAVRARR